jgi:Tfp pilus assembly protein PilO
MPKLGRLVSGGELDLAVYEIRLSETKAYADSLKSVVTSYQSVNPDRRSRVLNMVPVTPDAPGLYVQVDTIARTHGLVLVSIDAVPDEKSSTPAGRKTVRVAINVAGATYQQFKLFLADIERSERVLDVQAVIFTPSSGNYGLVLRAYSLDQMKILQPAEAVPVVDPTAAPAI